MRRFLRYLFIWCFTFLLLLQMYSFGTVQYRIQCGVFSNLSNAQNVKSGLEDYKVTVEEKLGKWYVYVGNYSSKEEATIDLAEIRKQIPGAYVKTVIVENEKEETILIQTEEAKEIETKLQEVLLEMEPTGEEPEFFLEQEESYEKLLNFSNDLVLEKALEQRGEILNFVYPLDNSDNLIWKVEYEITNLEERPFSTITFYVNEKPLKSYYVEALKNQRTLYLQLPKTYLKEGQNNFQIKGYQRLSDVICADNINPGHWILISKNSGIWHKPAIEVPSSYFLSDFPNYFLTEDSKYQICILREQDSIEQLEISYNIVSHLSKRLSMQRENIILDTVENQEKYENINRIFLRHGEGSEISLKLKQINEKYDLYLTGGQETAKKLFSDSELFLKMQGKEATLVYEEQKERKLPYRLENFGYGVFLEEGNIEGGAEYYIKFPRLYDAEGITQMTLLLGYVPYEEGAITILFNEKPVYQYEMAEYEGEYRAITFEIPSQYTEEGSFNLMVNYDYDIPENPCDLGLDEKPLWFYVDQNSLIEIKYKIREKNAFRFLPAPLTDGIDKESLSIVLHQKTKEEINAYKDIICFLSEKGFWSPNIKVREKWQESENSVILVTDALFFERYSKLQEKSHFSSPLEEYYADSMVPWIRTQSKTAFISELLDMGSSKVLLFRMEEEAYNLLGEVEEIFPTADGEAILINENGIIQLYSPKGLEDELVEVGSQITDGANQLGKENWFRIILIGWIILLSVVFSSIYFIRYFKNSHKKDSQN